MRRNIRVAYTGVVLPLLHSAFWRDSSHAPPFVAVALHLRPVGNSRDGLAVRLVLLGQR